MVIVAILDYNTPHKKASINWRRRYEKFVPIFGLCYLGLYGVFFIVAMNYVGGPISPPPAVDAFAIVVMFPMIFAYRFLVLQLRIA